MRSWDALPPTPIRPGGVVTEQFLALRVNDYQQAASYVRDLPYGRNSTRDASAVLREQRGTCSTKHALLASLARELAIPINLMLGIYEMNERNTPGVGKVLRNHGLECVPEAHCYLRYDGERIDVTRVVGAADPIERFLYEEVISPEQIGDYKISFHRRFMREWMNSAKLPGLSLDDLWNIREQCIGALST